MSNNKKHIKLECIDHDDGFYETLWRPILHIIKNEISKR